MSFKFSYLTINFDRRVRSSNNLYVEITKNNKKKTIEQHRIKRQHCSICIYVVSFKIDNSGSNEQPNMSPSSLCSLQTFPPISHALLNRHHKPAHDSTAGVRRRTPYVVCAEKSSRASTRSADDYHATLKALNSKGRFPRKSLGQVSIFLCYVLFSENFWHDPLCCSAPKVIFFFFFEVFLWKLEGVLHRTEGGWGHGVLCLT